MEVTFKFYNLGYLYYVNKVYYQGPGNRLCFSMAHHRSCSMHSALEIEKYITIKYVLQSRSDEKMYIFFIF